MYYLMQSTRQTGVQTSIVRIEYAVHPLTTFQGGCNWWMQHTNPKGDRTRTQISVAQSLPYGCFVEIHRLMAKGRFWPVTDIDAIRPTGR